MSYPYGMQGAPAVGTGAPGLPSRSSARGEVAFVIPGSYLWTVPDGVFSICALCVAGGGGAWVGTNNEVSSGAGPATAYLNNFPVTPGQQIPVVVGDAGVAGASATTPATAGGTSYFNDTSTCAVAGGGAGGFSIIANGGLVLAGTGFRGGNGARTFGSGNSATASGGTAGGYSAQGSGGVAAVSPTVVTGNLGAGGAAASGTAGGTGAQGSGGIGMFGEGQSGATPGAAGSGGQAERGYPNGSSAGIPGLFGAGGSCISGSFLQSQPGAHGFVRILWGADRFFPSNDVGPS